MVGCSDNVSLSTSSWMKGRICPHAAAAVMLASCLQGASSIANEYTVCNIFDTQIGRPINSGVWHWRREKWLEPEGKVFATWEAQGSDVAANAEVRVQMVHCLPQRASQFYDMGYDCVVLALLLQLYCH